MRELKRHSSSNPIILPRVFRGHGTRTISVTGGKGGVGKSSVAVNLALGILHLGGRVLLIDGDLGLANADQLLGVHAPATLWDVECGRISVEDAVFETPLGICLLPACSGRKEMAELAAHSRMALVESINKFDGRFDFIVIDTAAGIGQTALDLASAGDIVLAVVTPDPTSVRDTFSVMKILSKEYGTRHISIVANMVSSRGNGIDLYRRLSQVAARFLPLTLDLAGVIVRDPCMAKAVIDRHPMITAYPASPAAKQISKLAEHLITSDRRREKMLNSDDSKEKGNS